METTLLSSKGQVIIPKTIRTSHHWKAGTRFLVEEVQGGVLLKPIGSFPATDVQNGLGCTGYQGAAKSLEEIQDAVNEEVAKAWRKGKR
ncbi:MAG: AbrB family transcriptional regulator [Desulfuromonadales bacterium GWD2_61_12]|nr:MAG: AbrB family transcriptional regulator [Desulfuromonadales bacterium GWC2_61_20]OGR36029.1 MAG: AbrB family transcriptional regulator [Desulfuromonadales bacterium GWD2_61_12]HAD04986.1 AbrB family transcriptional regulator [Desulfuromonas sp.]HBT83524.1 AbrB family transcriptional regulator [Desulfuromonas sp.]